MFQILIISIKSKCGFSIVHLLYHLGHISDVGPLLKLISKEGLSLDSCSLQLYSGASNGYHNGPHISQTHLSYNGPNITQTMLAWYRAIAGQHRLRIRSTQNVMWDVITIISYIFACGFHIHIPFVIFKVSVIVSLMLKSMSVLLLQLSEGACSVAAMGSNLSLQWTISISLQQIDVGMIKLDTVCQSRILLYVTVAGVTVTQMMRSHAFQCL